MEETRVSETLENILDAIDKICENIEIGMHNSNVSESSAVFVLARAFDLIAQYEDNVYEDGEYE